MAEPVGWGGGGGGERCQYSFSIDSRNFMFWNLYVLQFSCSAIFMFCNFHVLQFSCSAMLQSMHVGDGLPHMRKVHCVATCSTFDFV